MRVRVDTILNSGQQSQDRTDAAAVAESHKARILFLLGSLSIGGSERKIIRLANALAKGGDYVCIAYLNGPESLRTEIDAGIHVVHLQRHGKFSLRALRALVHVIDECAIDTLVAVNLYPVLYAFIARQMNSRAMHTRLWASVNTTEFKSRKSRIQFRLYRPLLQRMDLLIFGADYQRGLWLQRYFGSQCPPTLVLYNGVDTAYFDAGEVAPYNVEGWPRNRLILGTVGVLRPEKAHTHLLEAASRLIARGHDVGVVIVGEGVEEARLRECIERFQLTDRVRLPGAALDVRGFLATFDIFVLTSTAVETFSNAALEALSMQCPVLSSAVGGMHEMLEPAGAWTYRPGDIDELTDKLEQLICSAPTRQQMAARARELVQSRFSLQAMADKFRSALHGVADSRDAAEFGRLRTMRATTD
jgi:glycosyltransferase involved in cell wall biosynthesis